MPGLAECYVHGSDAEIHTVLTFKVEHSLPSERASASYTVWRYQSVRKDERQVNQVAHEQNGIVRDASGDFQDGALKLKLSDFCPLNTLEHPEADDFDFVIDHAKLDRLLLRAEETQQKFDNLDWRCAPRRESSWDPAESVFRPPAFSLACADCGLLIGHRDQFAEGWTLEKSCLRVVDNTGQTSEPSVEKWIAARLLSLVERSSIRKVVVDWCQHGYQEAAETGDEPSKVRRTIFLRYAQQLTL